MANLKHLHRTGLGDPAYSLRRHYVDEFLLSTSKNLNTASLVADIGGHKDSRRGLVDFNREVGKVFYFNIVADKGTDIVGDVTQLPIREQSFDVVLCSEVLEHVYDHSLAITEIYRVLKKGGEAILTIPMLYHIHGDPEDYGRYTESYLLRKFTESGFTSVKIIPQGGYWSVLADMIRMGIVAATRSETRWKARFASLSLRVLARILPRIPLIDSKSKIDIARKFTTGYGIVAVK